MRMPFVVMFIAVLFGGFLMRCYVRIGLGLLVGSACVLGADWAEPAAKPTVKVDLRWVETKRIEGVTENEGFQSSCDPKDIVYPHKKPALVITAAEVSEVSLRNLDYSKNGLSSENYSVTIHLTKAARAKLAATVEGKEMKLLTVALGGRDWGGHGYER